MPAATARRHQHLIISVFGLYRGLRGSIPIAALIRMLGELGVEPAGVRSSVSRLKKRGILASTQLGGAAGYALTPQFEGVYSQGDAGGLSTALQRGQGRRHGPGFECRVIGG